MQIICYLHFLYVLYVLFNCNLMYEYSMFCIINCKINHYSHTSNFLNKNVDTNFKA